MNVNRVQMLRAFYVLLISGFYVYMDLMYVELALLGLAFLICWRFNFRLRFEPVFGALLLLAVPIILFWKFKYADNGTTTITNKKQSKHDKLMEQGIWHDEKTGLYWDRCSVGQTWDGETCQGEPLELNWYDAQDYVAKFTNEKAKGGYTDWRVPTIEELSSIPLL